VVELPELSVPIGNGTPKAIVLGDLRRRPEDPNQRGDADDPAEQDGAEADLIRERPDRELRDHGVSPLAASAFPASGRRRAPDRPSTWAEHRAPTMLPSERLTPSARRRSRRLAEGRGALRRARPMGRPSRSSGDAAAPYRPASSRYVGRSRREAISSPD